MKAGLRPIVITGASGLLGANLVMEWRSLRWPVVALYGQHAARFGVPAFGIDLCDSERARKLIEDQHPAWVVHCAAATNVDWCENHPDRCFEINVEASRNLAIAATKAEARFLYISTDAVFDGTRGNYRECDPVCPVNVYAKSKVLAERAVAEVQPDSLIVRTNIFGWNMQEKTSLAEWMMRNFQTGTSFPGFADVVFSPLLVNDLAYLLAEMVRLQLTGLFHVAGTGSCNKFEFAELIASVFGYDRRLVKRSQVDDASLRAPRPRNCSLDIKKIAQVLGHSPAAIQDGIKRLRSLRDSGYASRLKAIAS